jgi:PAS domain S-box-containing protein
MILQFSPMVVLLLSCGILSIGFAVIGYYNRALPIARPFVLFMAAETVWLFGSACELMSTQLQTVLLINNIEYPAMMTVPVALLFIAFVYSGREHYLTKKIVPLFFIVPALVCLLVYTNPWHMLYYTGFHMVTGGGTQIWVYDHGPLFGILIVYSYLVGLAALILMAGRYLTGHKFYRWETLILVIAAAIPFLLNIAYVLHAAPIPDYDLTPVAFFLTGVIISAGLLRYQLFSAVPVAYSRVFSTLHDGVFVLDRNLRVIDLNPAAELLTGVRAASAIGKNLASLVPETAGIHRPPGQKIPEQEIQIIHDDTPRFYDVQMIPLDPEGTGSKGYLCIFREVTDRKQAELSLLTANKKINLLTRITRHDLENKLMIVHGYIGLLRKPISPEALSEYLEKQEAAVNAMHEQLAFMREYQQLGSRAPIWQNVDAIIRRAKTQVFFDQVRFAITVESADVYADQMLERVFYNLLDNALRYGGKNLTAVTVTSYPDSGALVIAVEDDGVGIPAEDQERLFEQGFGKHTGLGLFLSREILMLTDIAIDQTNPPGKGARFEIRIPPGKFRPAPGDHRQ